MNTRGIPWIERAVCAGGDSDWWELTGGESPDADGKLSEANRRAIRICAGCPVARQCFDEALALGDRGVIRGGIALFKPSERFRCATCGKVGLRPAAARRGSHPRRYCDDYCRAAARRVAGVESRQRQLDAVA